MTTSRRSSLAFAIGPAAVPNAGIILPRRTAEQILQHLEALLAAQGDAPDAGLLHLQHTLADLLHSPARLQPEPFAS